MSNECGVASEERHLLRFSALLNRCSTPVFAHTGFVLSELGCIGFQDDRIGEADSFAYLLRRPTSDSLPTFSGLQNSRKWL